MKIFFISEDIPYYGISGSSTMAYAWVKYFLESNEVTLFVNPPRVDLPKLQQDKMLSFLDHPNLTIVSLSDLKKNDVRKKNFFQYLLNPSIEDFYPVCNYKKSFEKKLKEEIKIRSPNILFTYGISSVYMTANIKNIPRLAPICEDPYDIYKSKIFNFNNNIFSKLIRTPFGLLRSYIVLKKCIEEIKKTDLYGQHSIRFYKRFKKLGADNLKFLGVPVIDPTIDKIDIESIKFNKNKKKFKIILVGQLSARTQSQYKLLFNKIIPLLEKKLPFNSFEIHLIGSSNLGKFSKFLEKKFIINRGYVEDLSIEYLSCDIFLSPSSTAVGGRTSILEAMAHGCCVLTTSYERNTWSHLKNYHNIIFASGAEDITNKILEFHTNNNKLLEIGKNARLTFEKHYAAQKVVKDYENIMIRLVKNYG